MNVSNGKDTVPPWTNLLVEEMRLDVQQAECSPQARSQEIMRRLGIMERAMILAFK